MSRSGSVADGFHPRRAVNRELSCMLLRSEAQLGGGVPVAFSGVEIAGDSAGIFEDTPQLHVTCAVTFLCFAPDEGQLVKGVVNNTASDSVGLLVLDTFNASITADGLRGYVHNAARGVWHREGDEDDEITIGQEIEFVCVEMRTHDKSAPLNSLPPLPPLLPQPAIPHLFAPCLHEGCLTRWGVDLHAPRSAHVPPREWSFVG